jgi:LmbE family N-acetylglucosaminyl deacetylase
MLTAPRGSPDKVLVVVAHPDDEVLGCGGTIRKLADAGCEVKVLLVFASPHGREWVKRLEAFERACAQLGASAARINARAEISPAESDLRDLHDLLHPWVDWSDTVFTHWHGDVHQVHRTVSRAVELATRPFRRRRNVFLFEVATSSDQTYTGTPFVPNTYVALEESHCALKCATMELYPDELTPGRTPQDLMRRLALRGTEAGLQYAEAFVAVRLFL